MGLAESLGIMIPLTEAREDTALSIDAILLIVHPCQLLFDLVLETDLLAQEGCRRTRDQRIELSYAWRRDA